MEKQFDLFVWGNEPRFDKHAEARKLATDYFLHELQDSLYDLGFRDFTFGAHIAPEEELTQEAIDLLLSGPVFVTEHYISRMYNFDQRSAQAVHFSPFRLIPTPGEYNFAFNGKRPPIMFHVAGGVATGKSLVIHELAKLLREKVPGINVIECPVEEGIDDKYDLFSNPEMVEQYRDSVVNKAISLGDKPQWQLGRFNQTELNVKL